MTDLGHQFCVLVPSCDAYADTWEPFFHFFWKHWPNCPVDVFLGTNFESFADDRIKVIQVGEDANWADGVQAMLDRLPTPTVLLLLEDYFLSGNPHDNVLALYEVFNEINAKYLMLTPTPRPDRSVTGFPQLGLINDGARYKTAIGASFWNVETFQSLLKSGETAWEMEERGSHRARDLPGFYRCWNPAIQFHNAIVCGRWTRTALRYCERNGMKLETSMRPVYSRSETAWISVKSLIRRTISRLPEPYFSFCFSLGRKTLAAGSSLKRGAG